METPKEYKSGRTRTLLSSFHNCQKGYLLAIGNGECKGALSFIFGEKSLSHNDDIKIFFFPLYILCGKPNWGRRWNEADRHLAGLSTSFPPHHRLHCTECPFLHTLHSYRGLSWCFIRFRSPQILVDWSCIAHEYFTCTFCSKQRKNIRSKCMHGYD